MPLTNLTLLYSNIKSGEVFITSPFFGENQLFKLIKLTSFIVTFSISSLTYADNHGPSDVDPNQIADILERSKLGVKSLHVLILMAILMLYKMVASWI